MNKYLVLYNSQAAIDGKSVAEVMASAPPEQLQAGMAMWTAWMQKCGPALVDMGAPLDKPTKVTPDSVTSNRSSITGFTILQAESMEKAAELLKGHPHFFAPESSVEIFEFIPIPGM